MTFCLIRDFSRAGNLAKTFSEWVIDKRTSSGLSQRRLAKLAGVTPPMISKLESGGSGGSPEMVNKIADALGASRLEAMSAWVSGETGEDITYIRGGDASIVAEAYEGLPPAFKKHIKGQVLSAAELAREMDQERLTCSKRADHNDNPSRPPED